MFPDLTDNVAMILALSAASERLVALVKGSFEWLHKPTPADPHHERLRQWSLRLIAVISGIITAALSSDSVFGTTDFSWRAVVGLGILAGGGSDLWNSVLGYLNSLKDEQKKVAR